jgi:hypothetical protein
VESDRQCEIALDGRGRAERNDKRPKLFLQKNNPLVVIDERGRVINANMNYAYLSGHASVDEIPGGEGLD